MSCSPSSSRMSCGYSPVRSISGSARADALLGDLANRRPEVLELLRDRVEVAHRAGSLAALERRPGGRFFEVVLQTEDEAVPARDEVPSSTQLHPRFQTTPRQARSAPPPPGADDHDNANSGEGRITEATPIAARSARPEGIEPLNSHRMRLSAASARHITGPKGLVLGVARNAARRGQPLGLGGTRLGRDPGHRPERFGQQGDVVLVVGEPQPLEQARVRPSRISLSSDSLALVEAVSEQSEPGSGRGPTCPGACPTPGAPPVPASSRAQGSAP